MKRAFPWIINLLLAVWCVRLHLSIKKQESVPHEMPASEAAAIGAETNSAETLTAADRTELGELRKERTDLLRLRNEVRQLRDSKKELDAKLVVQESQLQVFKSAQERAAANAPSPNVAAQFGKPIPAPDPPALKSGMIGAMFMPSNNLPLVRAVADNSPAGRAGIKPGAVVLSIDGTSTTNMPFAQVMQAIRGDEGTQVVLVVDDGLPNGIRQVTLIREAVNPADVRVKQ